MPKLFKTFVFVTCLIIGSLNSAFAKFNLQEVQETLTHNSIIRANFQQERHLKGFNQSLKSQGSLLYSKNEGIVWQQTAPFALTIIINDQSIRQKSPNLKEQVLNFQDNPTLHSFSTLLKALITLDEKALTQFFQLDFKDLGSSWLLTLTPKQEPLDKIFSKIELTGDIKVLNITLFDKALDQTIITFSDHDLSNRPLSEAEVRSFE